MSVSPQGTDPGGGAVSRSAADLSGTHPVGAGSGGPQPWTPNLAGATDGLHLSTPQTKPEPPLPGSGALTPPPENPPPQAEGSIGTTTFTRTGTTTSSGTDGSFTASGAVRGTVNAGTGTVTQGTNTDGTPTVRSLTVTGPNGSAYAGAEFSATTAPNGQPVPGLPTAGVNGAAAIKVDGSLGSMTIGNPDSQSTMSGPKVGVDAGAKLEGTVALPLGASPGSPVIQGFGGISAGGTGSLDSTGTSSFTPRASTTVGGGIMVPIDDGGLEVTAGYKVENDLVHGTATDAAFLRVTGRDKNPAAEIDWNPQDGSVKVQARFEFGGPPSSAKPKQEQPVPRSPAPPPIAGGHGIDSTYIDVRPAHLDRLVAMHDQRGELFSAAGHGMAQWQLPPAAAGHPLAAAAVRSYLADHVTALHGHARHDTETGEKVARVSTTYETADNETAEGFDGLVG